MEFVLADYEQLLGHLHDAQQRINDEYRHLSDLMGRYWIVGGVVDAWAWIQRNIEDFIYQLGVTVLDAPVPIHFWECANGWTEVRGDVTLVSANLSDGNPIRTIHNHWTGFAANNYYRIVPLHQAAANELGIVADKVQQALSWTAEAAAAFYITVLGQTLALSATLFAAGIAMVTIVGIPEALAAIAAALGQALSALATSLVAASGAYCWSKVFVYNVRSELHNLAAFPGGSWPSSQSGGYSDATVTDGDAEWSLRH
jgi:hypothetical protein